MPIPLFFGHFVIVYFHAVQMSAWRFSSIRFGECGTLTNLLVTISKLVIHSWNSSSTMSKMKSAIGFGKKEEESFDASFFGNSPKKRMEERERQINYQIRKMRVSCWLFVFCLFFLERKALVNTRWTFVIRRYLFHLFGMQSRDNSSLRWIHFTKEKLSIFYYFLVLFVRKEFLFSVCFCYSFPSNLLSPLQKQDT